MGKYELPNDTAYAETCASVALCFFSRAMSLTERDGKYGDAAETALYNTVLAGISLQADRFFYVNPLEVVQGVSGVQEGLKHDLPQRPRWYACACCPPNVARLLTSLKEYAVQDQGSEITVHQYLDGSVDCEKAALSLKTNYPWDGELNYTADIREDVRLYLRIPAWAEPEEVRLTVDGQAAAVCPEKGFVCLEPGKGRHEIRLCLPMKPRRIYAHEQIRQDAGCVAFARGPLVYCLEGCDNPEPLWNLTADPDGEIRMLDPDGSLPDGIRKMAIPGHRRTDASDALYSGRRPVYEPQELTAIPYYAWANREPRDMRVWVREG